MTVARLEREMSSDELSEWMVKDRIDPPVDHWLISGQALSTIANVMGSGKKHYAPEFFYPFLKQAQAPKRKQTVQEMKAIFGGFAVRHSKAQV